MGRWVVCERVCMAGLQAAQGGARDSPATALAPGLATVYCGLWWAACGVCSVLSESMCGPSRAFERWPCGACGAVVRTAGAAKADSDRRGPRTIERIKP